MTTTKCVLMENNKVIGTGWTLTKDIMESVYKTTDMKHLKIQVTLGRILME